MKKTIRKDNPDGNFELTIKIPLLKKILIILFFLSLLIIIQDVLRQAVMESFILHGVLPLVILSALIGIRKDYYTLTSNLFFSLCVVILVLLRMRTGYEGPQSIPLFAVIVGSFVVFAAVFVTHRMMKTLIIIYDLTFAIFIGISFFNVSTAGLTDKIYLQILYPSIAVITISTGLVFIRRISDALLSRAKQTLEEVESMNGKIRSIMTEAALQLDKADILLHDARETASAGTEIEMNVRNLNNRIQDQSNRFTHTEEELGLVHTSMESLFSLSRNQNDQIHESGSAIEEMAASINNVTVIIHEKTRGIDQLLSKSREGDAVVNQTRDAFGKVAEKLGSIADMTKMISKIAAQTNLLAMNAAIEAAHAGDSGKGFSVVASEIRNLAESSSRNAKDIGDTTNELVNSIHTAEKEIDSTSKSFSEIHDEINDLSHAIAEIEMSASELNAGSSEILSSTGQLTSITGDMNRQLENVREHHGAIVTDMGEVSRISGELNTGMEEISVGITLIRESIHKISELSSELKTQSEVLNQEFDN